MTDLVTVAATRRAIRKARVVYAQIRFGCSEHWSVLTKTAALALLETLDSDDTPESVEMFGGCFATLDEDGALWLG